MLPYAWEREQEERNEEGSKGEKVRTQAADGSGHACGVLHDEPEDGRVELHQEALTPEPSMLPHANCR